MNENGTPGQDPTGAQPAPPPPPGPPPADPQPPADLGGAQAPPPQPTTPPPAAGQPAPGQPTGAPPQPGQPAKKNRTPLIIILAVVFVLLLCCCSAGGYLAYDAAQAEALAEEQATEVIDHMNAADQAALELETLVSDYEASASLDEPFPVEEAQTQLDLMRSELTAAEDVAVEMRESTFRTEILDAIEHARVAIDLYETSFGALGSTLDLVTSVEELADEMIAASDQLNEAVSLMNSKDYADGKKEAQAAKTAFEKVAADSRALAAEYPQSEGEKLAVIADKNAEQAGHVVKQGDYGPGNQVSKYNDEVDAYNDLTGEIAALPFPAWFDDPDLIMGAAEATFDSADEAMVAAEESIANAQAALLAGEY
jgi:hypothetical protein